MTKPDRCPESKTFTVHAANTHGYVGMKEGEPVVERGEKVPEGTHRRCTAAMANRTIEGIPVVEDVVERFCNRIHAECPVFTGANRVY